MKRRILPPIGALASMLCLFGLHAPDNFAIDTPAEPALRSNSGNQTEGARLVPFGDSSAKIAIWNTQTAEGTPVEYYSITLDGATYSRPRVSNHALMLRYATFDPHQQRIDIPPTLAAGDDNRLYIMQFVVPALEEFRREISNMGATIRHFVPNNAYLVELDNQLVGSVESLPFVRSVLPYHPAFRLDESLRALVANEGVSSATVRCNIQVTERGPLQKQTVADRIVQLGGEINVLNPNGFRFEATLTPDQLLAVAHYNEVAFIDPWTPTGNDMNIVRASTGANYLEDIAGYTGQGVSGEVMEMLGSFFSGHDDFQTPAPLIHASFDADPEHGTSTYGILFADGLGNPHGRGMLPDAQGIFAGVNSNFDRYQHTADLLSPTYNAVFQSNSWGNLWTPNYTTLSAELDDIMMEHPILLAQSMSNQGTQQARPQAWSKNVVSVGGVFHENTTSFADDHWTFGASIGPASDGRIKPDLSHYYDSIFTTAADGTYRQFCCTSAATPIVAGHFGLFFQMWADGVFGNTVVDSGNVFENRCEIATAKAILINTAYSYPFEGTSSDLTRTHQGWGLPDVQRLYLRRDRMFIVDETDVLTNLSMKQYVVVVLPGESDLRATLVYTDPAGLPGMSVHRVNDLSLRVISPSQSIYWGNNGLRSGNWSTHDGVSNTIDTVENVFVQNPEPGTWVVEIYADEINLDGHTETAEIDADFALVVSGASAPTILGDCDADQDVELTDFPAMTTCLTGPQFTIANTCACTDFDDDDDLDLPDIAEFQNHFDCVAPLLTTSPSGSPVCPNESVTLTTVAQGNAPLAYQWFRDGQPIAGATSSSLSIPSFTESDAGSYAVSVSNACGSMTSAPAELPSCAVLYFDDFETDQGWTVVNDPAMTRGQWLRSEPIATSDGFFSVQPGFDNPLGAGTKCFVTGPFGGSASANDVDGGPTTMYSPIIDLSGQEQVRLRYSYWYYRNDGENFDSLNVALSYNGGLDWVDIHQHYESAGEWRIKDIDIDAIVPPTNNMQFRFTIKDSNGDSILEALIDDFLLSAPN